MRVAEAWAPRAVRWKSSVKASGAQKVTEMSPCSG